MITTERLLIRPWKKEDTHHYATMAKDVGYNCFAPPGIYLTQNETELQERVNARIDMYEKHGLGKWPVFEKNTGEFVGTCGADFFEHNGSRDLELGYRLLLSHWSKGFATEAGRAVAKHLRSTKKETLYGFALPENRASLMVLEKIGFVYQYDFHYKGLLSQLYIYGEHHG